MKEIKSRKLFRSVGTIIIVICICLMFFGKTEKEINEQNNTVVSTNESEELEETYEETLEETYEERVNIENIIESKWKEILSIEGQPEFLYKINESSSYKIETITENEGIYVVSTVVEAPNVGKALFGMSSSELSKIKDEKELNKFLCEKVNDSPIERINAYIYVYEYEGKYQVEFSDLFVDAMSGSLYKASQDMMVDMLEKGEKE